MKLKTINSLGWGNVARVVCYRLRLRLNLHPVQRISATVPAGPFFRPPAKPRHTGLPVNRQWHGQHCYFDWYTIKSDNIPNWFLNPFTGKRFPDTSKPWWQIDDFIPETGDIKAVWEPSRFGWLFGFAQQTAQADSAALDKLNRWLTDWVEKNPPYQGPNWKCGQEASIRVMHLAMTALILEQVDKPAPALTSLITAHLKRIAPTISYALAQNNNHGTSEAAALFIGGSWLAAQGDKRGRQWARSGRRWLEDRARKLIEPDGSFSQYSVNYHRVMLDTYCMAEVWRRRLNLPDFSPELHARLAAAAIWLHALVIPQNGNAPNLGTNDGARLLPLTDTDYQDYRPTLTLAMNLFYSNDGTPDRRITAPPGALECGELSPLSNPRPGAAKEALPLLWLNLSPPSEKNSAPAAASVTFPDGGYSVLRIGHAFAVLRYPRFRFRPGQADALHVDLWLGSENVLRDGGTFSYADPEAMQYFQGTAGHNTIQFDDREQMPRLGRFLFGEWLQAENVEPLAETPEALTAGAGYTDWRGTKHFRRISLSENTLDIEDRISGFQEKAVLRWRLTPKWQWTLTNTNECRSESCVIRIETDGAERGAQLTEGWESRYYMEKHRLPVLEVAVREPSTINTRIKVLTTN